MSALRLPPLSLYIHIPWCTRKCPYCDFNSHESKASIPEQAYINALQTDLQQSLYQAQGRKLHSIFFGGGTPSLFSSDSIRQILDAVSAAIEIEDGAEITLEANPGSAEAEKFEGFVAAGINRISLGVQSFDNRCLEALGRIHNSDEARAAIEIIQSVGLRSFNIDLMHGLPEQSMAQALTDVQIAAAYTPPHLSWYQLTIEPNTHFHKQRPTLPTEQILVSIQDQGESLLAQAGYTCYEVSAWSQSGFQCHHNLNYWSFGDYIGIGAGAHCKWTDIQSERVYRSARSRQPEQYMAAPKQIAERILSTEDLIGEYMMNALRLTNGFEISHFSARTGLNYSAIGNTVDKLENQGLLQADAKRIKPSPLGQRYLDSVVGEFF